MMKNPLATKDQLAIEDLAMALFRSAPVIEAMAQGRRLLQADPRARTPAGSSTLELNLTEIAFHACTMTVADTPENPRVCWSINLPHRWFGRDVPGSRAGIDNPDVAYRLIALSDQGSYQVTGHVPAVPPVDVSFTVFPVWPGLIDAEGIFPGALGGLTLQDLAVDSTGGFSLTLDPTPADGRRNHLQIRPGARNLFVRDALSDWARETPLELSVSRIDRPTPAIRRDEATLAPLAAANVAKALKFWMDLPAHYYHRTGPNQFSCQENPAFAKGGQFTANGNFQLRRDEAYVFTLDPLGTRYLGVQLADVFGASLEYAHHTSSLNSSQTVPNADGTITYVLSLADPGVHNWLDPTGLDTGLYMFRYQGYDAEKVTSRTAIRSEQVVKLSQLDQVLPTGTRRVSAAERQQQLAERAAAYGRRLSGS